MKQKIHLKFADVINITGISERTFRYRIAELKVIYKDSPDLLFKKGHSWRIHVSLISEFNNKHTNKN
jgi:hypothetical protein